MDEAVDSPSKRQRPDESFSKAVRALSAQMLHSVQRSETLAPEASNAYYERWIEHADGKQRFEQLVTAAAAHLALALADRPKSDQASRDAELVIGYGGATLRFDQALVWVGRRADCDVRLDGGQFSRRQFVLAPLRELGLLALVPLGGLASTAVVQRSGSGLDKITPIGSVLTFALDEVVELELAGSARLTINPRLCVVCEDHARSQQLDCGHFATCAECTPRLDACPLCRAPIAQPVAAFRLQTCARQ